METLLQWDTRLFYIINGCRSGTADVIFAFLSSPISIALLLLIILAWASLKPDRRTVLWLPILLMGACFLFADRVSVLCFKEVFCRLRPCHALDNVFLVKLKGFSLVYDHCGGQYGFISSHAANVFSLSTALGLYFHRSRPLLPLLFLWASLVGYSRIYCGVHYLGDILGGSIVGILIGWGLAILAKMVQQRFYKKHKT